MNKIKIIDNWDHHDSHQHDDHDKEEEEFEEEEHQYLGALHVLEPNVLVPANFDVTEINAFGNEDALGICGLHHAVVDLELGKKLTEKKL